MDWWKERSASPIPPFGFRGTDVEDLENVAVEQLSAFEAMLYRGASKSAINGGIKVFRPTASHSLPKCIGHPHRGPVTNHPL